MASRPSSASAVAPPAAIKVRTLSRTSSGRTPRQSASRYRSHWGLYWSAEKRSGSPSPLHAVVT
eukprot:15464048-Alexandrium_andersonii.AAC.1